MIRKSLLFAALLCAAVPRLLSADPSPVVVELYTSQGCSSCPPADDLMADLAQRPDVIALALHVDYWDYIGWKDEFADPSHTTRQQGYAHAGGRQMIYTPQMIVGGTDDIVGARSMELAELLAKHKAAAPEAALTVTRVGTRLTLRSTRRIALKRPADIFLFRYEPSRTVDITRGENAGRRLTYHNIVTDWQGIGQWDGKADLDLTVDLPGDLPAVIVLQTSGPGRILTALRVPQPSG